MKTIASFLLTVVVLALAACGGGGGGGSSGVLINNIQGVSQSTMTVGNASAANGGVQLVFLDKIKNLFNSIKNPLISSAYAQSISTCANPNSSQLIGTKDLKTWNVMGLTASDKSTACVNRFQDAGNHIILATSGITDSSGKICDLVIVTKASGATTCISMDLPKRAITGNPTFIIGLRDFTPGQLTLNGNYFMVGFHAVSSSAGYIGFERIDFTGETPTGKIAYMEYGTQISGCAFYPSVNSSNLFFSAYFLQENGNFLLNQFNVSNCDATAPIVGVTKQFYVDVNNSRDPLNSIKYLFNIVNNANPDRGEINSPAGGWLNANFPSTDLRFYVYPGGSTSANDLSFYITTWGYAQDRCTTGNGTLMYDSYTNAYGVQLIKVVINDGVFSFQKYGTTNIGDRSGGTGHYLINNAYLSSDGLSLVSVHWMDDQGSMKLNKISRQLSPTACDVYTKLSPPSPIATPANLSNNISISGKYPLTYRSKDYIYMLGHYSNGCGLAPCKDYPIAKDAQIWSFNKKDDTISVISLNELDKSVNYYSISTFPNPLSNTLHNTWMDESGFQYFISFNNRGVFKLIKFPASFDISNGFVAGTN